MKRTIILFAMILLAVTAFCFDGKGLTKKLDLSDEQMKQVGFVLSDFVSVAVVPDNVFTECIVAQDYVRWVANQHVKPARHSEHPLAMKEVRMGVLVVGVPCRELPRGRVVPAVVPQQFRDFAAKAFVILAAFGF